MVTVKEYMKLVGVREEDTKERVRRRQMIGCGRRRAFDLQCICVRGRSRR